MDWLIVGGTVVTGDGQTVIEGGTVVVEGGLIREVRDGGPGSARGETIDARGYVVCPGFINNHAHGLTVGPMSAHGQAPVSREQALANLDRHVLEGSTTLICLDGLITPEDLRVTADVHPAKLRLATIHTPANIRAAKLSDGEGLNPARERLTAQESHAAGAVVVGEVGSGGVLGGGAQDYKYVPEAVARATGREINPKQARVLKEAVLGSRIDPAYYQRERVQRALEEIGIADAIDPEDARRLVEEAVLPSMEAGIEALYEAADVAATLNLPLILHHAPPSEQAVLEISTRPVRLVAGHSNHPSFTVEEAVAAAQRLKDRGAIIDVATVDSFERHRMSDSPAHALALVDAGLADTLSTDYAAGDHDPMPLAVKTFVERGVATLAQAIALATGMPARVFAEATPNTGLLEAGRAADLILLDATNLARVDTVLIDGQAVARAGQRV